MDGGGGTPRPVLLTGANKSHLGCMIRFQLPMGFQNFIKILIFFSLIKKKLYNSLYHLVKSIMVFGKNFFIASKYLKIYLLQLQTFIGT